MASSWTTLIVESKHRYPFATPLPAATFIEIGKSNSGDLEQPQMQKQHLKYKNLICLK